MSSSAENDMHEGFAKVHHGLPYEREREKMSVLRLAELLSSLEKDSPGYIVIEHELNLKIAKVQAKATLQSGWLGAAGSVLATLAAFGLGYFIGTSQPKETNNIPRKEAGDQVQPPVAPSAQLVVPAQPIDTKSGGNKDQQKQPNENTKP